MRQVYQFNINGFAFIHSMYNKKCVVILWKMTPQNRLHEALATPLVITLDIMKIFNNLHYYTGLGHPSLPKHTVLVKRKNF